MGKAIMEHMSEEYGVTLSQIDIFRRYHIDTSFIDDMCSKCPSWCEEASKRTIKTTELPPIVRSSLKAKYDLIEHKVTSSNLEPWVITYIGAKFRLFEEAHITDVKKRISLALVDASHDLDESKIHFKFFSMLLLSLQRWKDFLLLHLFMEQKGCIRVCKQCITC
ncbi:hypothetical protein O6H91_17G055300 [Diphasiastrum complanatum]|uniref:Uncharacterized protein n=1 Tax=Diphasiastrum complanatum TaxID=34168 RepID=A0ACC2B6X0_DIPCM|nr:hypothetical protein O6H91_17G055300 [Diphasiastrum complanatum]